MYLTKIDIKNYGAIKNVELSLPFDENDNPLPIVFVGKNGTGKTLLLTQIIDSLIEFKRSKYKKISEVNENNYYKVGSKRYIHTSANHSYINLNTVPMIIPMII